MFYYKNFDAIKALGKKIYALKNIKAFISENPDTIFQGAIEINNKEQLAQFYGTDVKFSKIRFGIM